MKIIERLRQNSFNCKHATYHQNDEQLIDIQYRRLLLDFEELSIVGMNSFRIFIDSTKHSIWLSDSVIKNKVLEKIAKDGFKITFGYVGVFFKTAYIEISWE